MRFYRTGEVVTDIGIIAFKNLLEEMCEREKLNFSISLENNYLEVKEIEDFPVKYTNFIWKKLQEKKDEQEEIKKEDKGTFVPYLRNSGKFGANAGSETVARENFKKLINLVGHITRKETEVLAEYGRQEDTCSICKTHHTTKIDINEKERKTSKYIYSFLGSEQNSYSNYGKENIKVCFVCEFLYLNFLIFANMGNYNIVYTESLKELDFFNYKINLFKDTSDLGFYQKMVEFNKRNLKVYRMNPDPNKGIMMKLISNTNFGELITNMRRVYLLERFSIKSGDRTNLKRQIEVKNNEYVKEYLLSKIFEPEGERQKVENVTIFLKFIKTGGKIMEERNFDDFFFKGQNLSAKLKADDAKTTAQERIAFRLIKLMQSDNRARILEEIMHLLVVNKIEIPFKFSEVVMKADRDNLHYAVGRFIEGIMN